MNKFILPALICTATILLSSCGPDRDSPLGECYAQCDSEKSACDERTNRQRAYGGRVGGSFGCGFEWGTCRSTCDDKYNK